MLRLPAILCAAALFAAPSPAGAADPVGVSPTEIKVGGIFPFSGPASALGLVGKAVLAYVQAINDQGGVNGRKIRYIAYDDAYLPPKAVEHARKLVEDDEVAFMFGELGTPGNAATAKYLLSKRVPSLGIVTGATRFTVVKDFPLTTTSLVSYQTEGRIYAKYLTKVLPGKKYAVLYQNDDLGKDYLRGFQEQLQQESSKQVVSASYEVSDPTVDSQIVNLRSAGAEALFLATTPKFAAQAIRKANELGWKPLIIVNYPSSSVGATLKPAGLDVSTGVVAGTILQDATDPQWDDNPGMKNYRAFVAKYLPGADISDSNYLFGYVQGTLLEYILKQCGNDLSRENIARQAKNLKDVELANALPGIRVTTTDAVNTNFSQMRLQRWTGTRWDLFSEVLDASSD